MTELTQIRCPDCQAWLIKIDHAGEVPVIWIQCRACALIAENTALKDAITDILNAWYGGLHHDDVMERQIDKTLLLMGERRNYEKD